MNENGSHFFLSSKINSHKIKKEKKIPKTI